MDVYTVLLIFLRFFLPLEHVGGRAVSAREGGLYITGYVYIRKAFNDGLE